MLKNKSKEIGVVIFLLLIFMWLSCNSKIEKPEQILEIWNDAHKTKDISELSRLYSEEIFYYGKKMSRNDCIEDKLKLFKKYEEYHQELIGEIKVTEINTAKQKLRFAKKVRFNNKIEEYPSYLVLEKQLDKWVIVEESDEVTDDIISEKEKKKSKRISLMEYIREKEDLKGDFNGDGKVEKLWLKIPKGADPLESNYEDCYCLIESSDSKINNKKIEYCLTGDLDNLGDLNGDGGDELGLLTVWFQGCWRPYFVLTYKNNSWEKLIPNISTHCNMWEEAGQFVEKDPNNPNRLITKCANDNYEDDNFAELIIKYVEIK